MSPFVHHYIVFAQVRVDADAASRDLPVQLVPGIALGIQTRWSWHEELIPTSIDDKVALTKGKPV
ncbi:unnamed protein product [Fusarium venenatum]|uniref:Uncharacterized protein n=1 Tax=Fusarium venenatum TaxID=56646 RepID=A0A2L2TKF9_9HYPO|nr:uncharacterized protein FVRRES_13588 [Fusarium venenatum]CEI41459.1 unnamed protein product [Fusarium venenatum]